MDRPIVDGRWRVHINGEGGMMVSVDLIAMVTSEASDGYERRLRAKRVMVVFNDTPMEEGSGVFFLTAHFVIPVISLLWRKVLECSSSLLTSSSLCPHSLRHPCVLTHFVIPVISLTSSSLCSHTHDLSSHPSHRYP